MYTLLAILFGRLLLSTVLGAFVGLQREQSGRPAGLRTHTLVCIGSALITIVSESYVGDEARIAAQIISGIGFLGAGTIIREGKTVRGLTTAASLWAVAGLGIGCGRGGTMMWLCVMATFLILGTLGLGKRLEEKILAVQHRNTLCVRGSHEAQSAALQSLTAIGIKVDTASRRRLESGRSELAVRLEFPPGMARERAIHAVMGIEGVTGAAWASSEAEPHAG
ncbi:MAG TPA: MgtC/SapB family protein [Armatimonadota bacterium]|jgi:putative Mg2+ transporter-C (MgtC) family protein